MQKSLACKEENVHCKNDIIYDKKIDHHNKHRTYHLLHEIHMVTNHNKHRRYHLHEVHMVTNHGSLENHQKASSHLCQADIYLLLQCMLNLLMR